VIKNLASRASKPACSPANIQSKLCVAKLRVLGTSFRVDACELKYRYIKTITVRALHRPDTENSKHIFPEKQLRGHSPNFHIHVSVSDLYIPTIDLPILLQENMCTDPDNILNKSLTDT
jgi:hypothetical protein